MLSKHLLLLSQLNHLLCVDRIVLYMGYYLDLMFLFDHVKLFCIILLFAL